MATVWHGTHEAELLDHVAPWREAELIDRAEDAEAATVELRARAERLETELLIAHLWVKELALWLEESPTIPADGRDARKLAPTIQELLDDLPAEPFPWRRLGGLALLVILPWVAIALAVYLLIAA